jgi:dienelactone hydrolase
VQWAKTQSDFDAKRWLLVGQSSGGFASIYTASKRPDGLVAVLAFAPGRGGRPDTHPGLPCAPDPLAKLFASVAPKIAVPVLWFYAENDEFIGPAAAKLWFESFHAAGGRGDFVMLPPFPQNRGRRHAALDRGRGDVLPRAPDRAAVLDAHRLGRRARDADRLRGGQDLAPRRRVDLDARAAALGLCEALRLPGDQDRQLGIGRR